MTKEESMITNLNKISPENTKVGSKAANLGKLIQSNFNVPDGFVITTNAYDLFLLRNNFIESIQNILESIDYDSLDSVEHFANTIREFIENGVIPNELLEGIKLRYQHYSNYGVAVRSSATAEDLPTLSFAGQYDTYLNLKDFEQVIQKIKSCYASLWTIRAIMYRYKNNIPHQNVKMAIIIQKMVLTKVAGVLFTINPMSSNPEEIIIESNFGLGESIVSGECSPDQFLVQKLKKGILKIISKRIGNKEILTQTRSVGIEYVKLPEDLKQQSSLSDNEIIKLAKLGLQIEKKFKNLPQDIEWVIDHNDDINILQTRPITAIKRESKASEILWSRGYSDDYWNDNVTPLYFELLGDQITKVVNIELNSIMGYAKMEPELLKLYHAHAYFNLNVIKKKIENEIPKFMRNEDILNYFPEGSGPYGKEIMKELPFHLIRRIVAELRVMIHDPDGSMSKTAEVYGNWSKEIFEPYCFEFDQKLHFATNSGEIKDIINLAEDLDKIMITHFRLIRYGIPVHNIGMNLLVQYLLTRFLSKGECLRFYPILVSGLTHKLTETNDRIHYLVSLINKSPELKEIFLDQKSANIYDYLKNQESLSNKSFLVEFEKFLNKYGDRGFTREAYYPRWREYPMTNVFDILKSLIKDKWQEIEKLKASNMKRRRIIEKIVETKFRSRRFGLLIWKFFSIILKNSRKYIVFRENQRFNLDKWITRNRNLYLEIGKIFVKEGIISDENKIFFLRKHEIRKLAFNKYNHQEIQKISSELTKRYEDFKLYEDKTPPKFLLGSLEFNDILKHNKQSKVFQGMPASQGIITGYIRVIEDINSISKVQAGEILVVPRTDPGWTPIFSKISGLITETGGILSHGAVVSREYGIPAVTNISNACEIFKNGQIIELNGFNGTVKIQKI